MIGVVDVSGALGSTAVLLAFVGALVGMVIALVGAGWRRPQAVAASRIYAWLVLLGAMVASADLIHAFLVHDFALSYVADNNARQTPLLYDVSGMWSALQGSILLWGLVLAGYVALLTRRLRRFGDDARSGWALAVAYGTAAFFFGLMVGPATPFGATPGPVPANGNGPNPLLQDNLLVAFHPPLMYLGLVGFAVPFALVVGQLVTGRGDHAWVAETRRWALFSWTCLSVAIVLGMWWSYQVLGWAGYWAWDPVENGPFLVWLASSAYLHSALAEQRRGLLRAWNPSLLLAAFAATILTTFITRSDVLQSVHSFSRTGDVGPLLLGLLGAVSLGGIVLIGWRADALRSVVHIDAPVSREGAFLANNALFAAFAAMVLIGTVFPILYQAVEHQTVTVGAPFFDEMAAPLALALIALMGLGPLLPWRKASRGVLWHRARFPAWAGALTLVASVLAGMRGIVPLAAFALCGFAGTAALRQLAVGIRRRRWRGLATREAGGMIVHLGVVAVVVAIVASSAYGHRSEVELSPGQSARAAGVTVTYLGTRTVTYPSHTSLVASLRLGGSRTRYTPAISDFSNAVEGVGTPAVVSSLWRNVYLTLDLAPSRRGGQAAIGVVVQPLLVWLWIGGAVIPIGALLALVAPERSPDAFARRTRKELPRAERRTPLVPPDAAVAGVGGFPVEPNVGKTP
jgi:cytochrome c-type biogenesis protein CcmF